MPEILKGGLRKDMGTEKTKGMHWESFSSEIQSHLITFSFPVTILFSQILNPNITEVNKIFQKSNSSFH